MHPAGFRNFLLLASSFLFVGLSVVPQSFSSSLRSGSGATCRLSQTESERRCRPPGQPPGVALCHSRGQCDCGVCICHVKEPGVYFGPLCECHEWVCETYDGRTCAAKCGHDVKSWPKRCKQRGYWRTKRELTCREVFALPVHLSHLEYHQAFESRDEYSDQL